MSARNAQLAAIVPKVCLSMTDNLPTYFSNRHFRPISLTGIGSQDPIECPERTFGSTEGLGALAQCLDCPAGHYCTANTADPAVCPPGGWMLSLLFPVSVFLIIDGISHQLGEHSASRALNCTQCPRGHYCPHHATSTSDMATSFICVAGLLCPPGLSAEPTGATVACPVGHYCLEGAVTGTPCPAGTYNPAVQSKTEAECSTCPPGYYCLGGSNTVSGECDPGYYCPAGSDMAQEQPCPITRYRNLPKGESVADCASCPAGTSCSSPGKAGFADLGSLIRFLAANIFCSCFDI